MIDDDEAIRRTLSVALRDDGYAVQELADGRSALAFLAQSTVDAVLLDQSLPDLSGADVLRALRSDPRTLTIPVIVVTGRGTMTEQISGLDAGADDYITKPFVVEELLARVRAQVRSATTWGERIGVIRERSALAAALARVTPEDARLTASSVASIIARLPDVVAVEVLQIGSDGMVTVLASTELNSSRSATAPQSLSGFNGIDLRPALASGAGIVRGARARDVSTNPDYEGVVCRLGSGDPPAGALVLTMSHVSSRGAPSPPASDVLAAMTDLAPVVENVLVPRIQHHQTLEAARSTIREIIDRARFETVFQPIVELASREVVGYEALTRFHDGTRPDLRFAEAQRSGLGHELELAAVESALRACARLPVGCYVSVNLSATVVFDPVLGRILSSVSGRAVTLEITEHEHVDDYAAVRTAVDALGPGVRLAVDDAGSGYASLRHVFALGPDIVKLDRGWVSGIQADPARQALVLGVTQFVERLGGSVVAEGVETAEELEVLARLGVPFAQGFFLGRPAAPDALRLPSGEA